MSEAPSAEGLYRTDLDDYRPKFERFFVPGRNQRTDLTRTPRINTFRPISLS
jgi:hypothetical protein